MISVQSSTKFICNTPVCPEIWRAGWNLHWDESSSAVGGEPSCYSVWFSQGQINAVGSFSHVFDGALFCLDTVVPLSVFFSIFFSKRLFYILKIILSALRLQVEIHFPMVSRSPSMSRESKPTGSWAGLLRPDKLDETCEDGKCAASPAGMEHRLGEQGSELCSASCPCFRCGETQECCLPGAWAWTARDF